MGDELERIREQLRARWDGRALAGIATAPALERLAAPDEWDPPLGVEPLRPPLQLNIGIPDGEQLPRAALADAMAKVMASEDDAHLRYGFAPPPLRQYLAAKYSRERGGFEVGEDWFWLTNGAAGGIDLVARCLIEPGDLVLVESPSYMGTLRNFRGVQARIRALPMDRDGLDVDALEQLLRELRAAGERAKLLYTISAFHNPTSYTLAAARRRRLLELAAEHDLLILEDDVYGDLYYGDEPPARLFGMAGGRGVIHVGSFSKILATGLRIGWILAHPDLIRLFTRMRFAMGQSQLGLRMLSGYLESGALEAHVADMRALYRSKMERLAGLLEQGAAQYLSFERPAGGFYLWPALRPPLSARALWRTALHEGVSVNAGYAFFPDHRDPGEHLRLAFSWLPSAQLESAAERLIRACERVARGDVA